MRYTCASGRTCNVYHRVSLVAKGVRATTLLLGRLKQKTIGKRLFPTLILHSALVTHAHNKEPRYLTNFHSWPHRC